MQSFDICIRGEGVVGRALALALSRQGLNVAWQTERSAAPRAADVRAYALNAGSIALLQSLKVWDALPAAKRTAVYDMVVLGDANAQLHFSSWQQAVRELAFIVDAAALEAELAAALRYAPHVAAVHEPVTASLLVLAEGRDAASREALGVQFSRQDYGQRAIAARLATDLPHAGAARQWFRSPDVLALLPMDEPAPGLGCALVWSLPQARAQALLAMDDAAFEAELMLATGGSAGALRLASARQSWPLMLGRADKVVGIAEQGSGNSVRAELVEAPWRAASPSTSSGRTVDGQATLGWALVGDAAHVIHPLAGQGLNLGLADVACLARVLAEREAWRPLGDARLLARYARERAGPTQAMAAMTDGLLQLFAHEAPWARELRNRGMGLVNQATPIKRWLINKALGA
jgi:2-polyprenyl-6-methoxyphenol hydroxylase-like FAD-dependent oxidoreductase